MRTSDLQSESDETSLNTFFANKFKNRWNWDNLDKIQFYSISTKKIKALCFNYISLMIIEYYTTTTLRNLII